MFDENENPAEPVNGALARDEGSPLSEQIDNNPVKMENFLINGEEVGAEDVEFDSVEDSTGGTVIDGEVGDERQEPARDQAYYGKNLKPSFPLIETKEDKCNQ